MADYQACYFCGSVDGVAERPVVPAPLSAPGDREESVPLCGACAEKRSALLEPVLAAAGAEGGRDTGGDRSRDADAATSERREPGGAEDGSGDGSAADGAAGEEPEDDPAPASDGDRAGDAEADSGSRADDEGSSAGRPPGYGKVMRLLRNREFPVERGAVETLATSAYDLSPAEASAVLDAAIARGELVEDGERLRRP